MVTQTQKYTAKTAQLYFKTIKNRNNILKNARYINISNQ